MTGNGLTSRNTSRLNKVVSEKSRLARIVRFAREFARLDAIVLPMLFIMPGLCKVIRGPREIQEGVVEAMADRPNANQKVLELMVSSRITRVSKSHWPGRFCAVAVEAVIPDYLYNRWLSILALFDQGTLKTIWRHEETVYYQCQYASQGAVKAKIRVFKFWRIYRSIKKYGIRQEVPIILIQDGLACIRADGAHRASVIRHFGYDVVTVLLLGTRELEQLNPQSPEQVLAVEWFKRRTVLGWRLGEQHYQAHENE